jgi:DDE family transposase
LTVINISDFTREQHPRPKAVLLCLDGSGTCEQWIKEGKGAIRWTWLSSANSVRLQLHALAYNLGFLCTLATPEPIKDWLLTSLKEKLIKIGAKVVSHGRYAAFQMAEAAVREPCSPTSCG